MESGGLPEETEDDSGFLEVAAALSWSPNASLSTSNAFDASPSAGSSISSADGTGAEVAAPVATADPCPGGVTSLSRVALTRDEERKKERERRRLTTLSGT